MNDTCTMCHMGMERHCSVTIRLSSVDNDCNHQGMPHVTLYNKSSPDFCLQCLRKFSDRIMAQLLSALDLRLLHEKSGTFFYEEEEHMMGRWHKEFHVEELIEIMSDESIEEMPDRRSWAMDLCYPCGDDVIKLSDSILAEKYEQVEFDRFEEITNR